MNFPTSEKRVRYTRDFRVHGINFAPLSLPEGRFLETKKREEHLGAVSSFFKVSTAVLPMKRESWEHFGKLWQKIICILSAEIEFTSWLRKKPGRNIFPAWCSLSNTRRHTRETHCITKHNFIGIKGSLIHVPTNQPIKSTFTARVKFGKV